MDYSAAASDQPLPTPGKDSANAVLEKRYGTYAPTRGVVRDIQERALKAQHKYKLDRPGLYTFNGRSHLLDFYQEILDAIIYMMAVEMECQETGQDLALPFRAQFDLVKLAARVREVLREQGVDIRDDVVVLG